MKYIGLISDTHGVFSDEFRAFLEPVDEIWHAAEIAGNCDNHDLRYDHPLHRVFECEGLKVLMIHIGGYPGRYDVNARRLIDQHRPDLFICGHSHILKVVRDTKRNMLVINPGAAGIQGFHLVRTALRFRLDAGRIYDMEVFELDR